MDRYIVRYTNKDIIKGVMSIDAENEHQARYKFCQKKGNYNSIISIEKVDKIELGEVDRK